MLNIDVDVVKTQVNYPLIGKSFNGKTYIRIQISHSFHIPIGVFHIEVKSKPKWFPFYIRREQSISLNDEIKTNEGTRYFVPFSNDKQRDYKVIINEDNNNIKEFSLD